MSHRASCGGHPDPFTFLHPFPSKIAPAGSSGAGTISRGTKLGSMTSHTHTERERERERENAWFYHCFQIILLTQEGPHLSSQKWAQSPLGWCHPLLFLFLWNLRVPEEWGQP
jgi:hypothetical protein